MQGDGKERRWRGGAAGLQPHSASPPLPSALTKLSALCKSPRIAPGLKGRPFRKLQSWSQAQSWQPRPVLGRGGRGVLCRRQMFLFSRADGARRAWRAQMGGSGEGAREAVSMSTHMVSVECDFAGRRSRFPSSAVQTLRARHASISGASRPALLSLCPFSKCFFGTPPPATPCDISPARMLLLTPRSCGSWFPDPPTSPSFPQLLPPSSGETSPRSPSLIGGTVTPLPTPPKLPGLLLLASPRCALQTCPQIL